LVNKRRWSSEDKIRIVLESLKTNISIAELFRKHNIQPPTFYLWREKFLEGGKAVVAGTNGNVSRQLQKENEKLKRIIAELTIANDAFKKTLEGSKR